MHALGRVDHGREGARRSEWPCGKGRLGVRRDNILACIGHRRNYWTHTCWSQEMLLPSPSSSWLLRFIPARKRHHTTATRFVGGLVKPQIFRGSFEKKHSVRNQYVSTEITTTASTLANGDCEEDAAKIVSQLFRREGPIACASWAARVAEALHGCVENSVSLPSYKFWSTQIRECMAAPGVLQCAKVAVSGILYAASVTPGRHNIGDQQRIDVGKQHEAHGKSSGQLETLLGAVIKNLNVMTSQQLPFTKDNDELWTTLCHALNHVRRQESGQSLHASGGTVNVEMDLSSDEDSRQPDLITQCQHALHDDALPAVSAKSRGHPDNPYVATEAEADTDSDGGSCGNSDSNSDGDDDGDFIVDDVDMDMSTTLPINHAHVFPCNLAPQSSTAGHRFDEVVNRLERSHLPAMDADTAPPNANAGGLIEKNNVNFTTAKAILTAMTEEAQTLFNVSAACDRAMADLEYGFCIATIVERENAEDNRCVERALNASATENGAHALTTLMRNLSSTLDDRANHQPERIITFVDTSTASEPDGERHSQQSATPPSSSPLLTYPCICDMQRGLRLRRATPRITRRKQTLSTIGGMICGSVRLHPSNPTF